MIRARLAADASDVPTRRALPNITVRAAAKFDPQLRAIVPDLGCSKKTSNEKARRILQWTPRDPEEAVIAAAESLVKKGLSTEK
ncbi:hypothetical protein GTY65_00410 [Streptomyces sp. SID8379]|uniref:hypothetical protein n=1 Tax=unclassified Streptomyces TaxID=2593676 RepID=UPI00035E1F05|nr:MULTISPECIES: hypothetical protein [unclassified Streptomyces]MYW62550.1 hypothetical protein [Streptomyces sp. SID8379]